MPQRALWLLIGLLATGAGIAGIVLPLVPTTPFLLVAAFAFARSSDRLHSWLVTHPRLGPPITDWRDHGAISRRAKVLAVAVMLATLAMAVLSAGPPGRARRSGPRHGGCRDLHSDSAGWAGVRILYCGCISLTIRLSPVATQNLERLAAGHQGRRGDRASSDT